MADLVQVRSSRLPSSRMLARLSPPEAPCKDISFGELWASVLDEYTPLNLTFEKGRLPALAGNANLIKQFEPGRYIVGMWEKELPYQLLWELHHTSGIGIHMPEMDIEHLRASIYSPLFSWTSWITQSEYYQTYVTLILVCEVIEIETVVPGLNKMAKSLMPISNSKDNLSLLSHCEFAFPIYKKYVRKWPKESLIPTPRPIGLKTQVTPVYPLIVMWINCWDELFFFKSMESTYLYLPETPPNTKCHGLVLRETEFTGTYTRVGVATGIIVSWIAPGNYLSEVKII
jgi:hypothetical protein